MVYVVSKDDKSLMPCENAVARLLLKQGKTKVKRKTPGDFQQTKGVRSQQRIPTGKTYGFRKFDKVKYLGKEYFIKGRMSSGYTILMDIEGSKIDFSDMPKGWK